MKKRKLLVILIIAVFGCGLLIGLASCEPAYSDGVTVRGVATNGVSEIELKSVDYKFNIVDYPSNSNFQGTNSTVTATYVYYNPTVKDATMSVYIKRAKPSYALRQGVDSVGSYTFSTTTEQEISIRCAYGRDQTSNYYDGMEEVGDFLKNIYEERLVDEYYNSNLPVYKYTFEFSDLLDNVNRMSFKLGKEYSDIKIFSGSGRVYSTIFDGFNRQYVYIDDNNTVTLYSIEKELVGIEEKIEFFNDDIVVPNGGKIASLSCETLTFDDVLMSYYDEESNLSSTDWYNAALSRVQKDGLEYLYGMDFFDMTDRMSYLYQCDLVVPAQTQVIQTVEMPIYPDINWGRADDVYIYRMDLSALSNWRGSPSVNVSIVSNGYYVESSSSVNLTPTLMGYEIEGIGSSTEKLSFALSEKPIAEDRDDEVGARFVTAFVVVIAIADFIPLVTVWMVLGIDIAKRKKAKKAAEESTATDKF